MGYNVSLEIFEGPLDLLLHLIRKNELDIYDIPVSVITEEYLEYLDVIRTLNLNVAGEFLLMASTLVHIKSKTLLPVHEGEEEEDEGEDPRDELVRRLLEYQRFKEAAEELGERRLLGRDVFTRGDDFTFDDPAAGAGEDALVNLSIFDLMDALGDVIKNIPKDYTIDIDSEKFRVVDKINQILETLDEKKSTTLTGLFPLGGSKAEVIVTFLAVLELCKLVMIRIHQTDDGIIRVYLPPERQEGADTTKEVIRDFDEYGPTAETDD